MPANPQSTLRDALDRVQPASKEEAHDLRELRALAATDSPWDRSSALHVTASALVVDPSTRRVLLRWHARQHAWLQVGGHGDPGEDAPLAVAMREGREETGLDDLRPWPVADPVPLHVVLVQVHAGGTEPAHRHGDVRYLLATDRPDAVVPEDDAAPLRWCSIGEAMGLTTEPSLRATLRRVDLLFESHT